MKTLSGAFAISLLTRLLQIGLAIALARALGQSGYGVYVFASGVGLIGARVAALGWPPLMLRLIPEMQARAQWALLAGLFGVSWRVVALAGVILGLGLGGLAAVGPPDLRVGLLAGAALIPFWALRALGRAQLNGLGYPGRGIVLDAGVVAGVMLGLVWLWQGRDLTETQALGGLVLVSAGALGLAYLWPRARLPDPARHAPHSDETRRWMAMALPLLVGMMARLAMEKSDILMLAPLAGLDAVGVYGAAARLCVMQTLAATTLNVVLSPAISAARARGQMRTARRLLHAGLAAAGLSAGLGAVVFWIWGLPIMGTVFGPDFVQGGAVLAVLGMAQVFGALSIILSGYLIVIGRQGAFAGLSLMAFGLSVAVNLALIPTFGAVGAAWASVGAQGVLCAGLLWAARS